MVADPLLARVATGDGFNALPGARVFEATRIASVHRVVPCKRIRIDSALKPDGVLAQEPPRPRLVPPIPHVIQPAPWRDPQVHPQGPLNRARSRPASPAEPWPPC